MESYLYPISVVVIVQSDLQAVLRASSGQGTSAAHDLAQEGRQALRFRNTEHLFYALYAGLAFVGVR